ncbi:MAG: hemerythrin domain-containing protein [Myxococcaceae bacterium]|nr:hemerythrin domain-containing protein [Myxococcaceae bacterium]
MGPFDILAEQHRELEGRLEALGADEAQREPQAQREQLEALLVLLRVHALLEERHLSPLLKRVEGRARAREQAEDHLAMSELTDELKEQEPGGAEWWARLTALEDLVVAHAREEELETFPRLTSTLDEEEQEALRRALLGMRGDLLARAHALPGSEPLLEAPRWET